jgi:hypothetical protein
MSVKHHGTAPLRQDDVRACAILAAQLLEGQGPRTCVMLNCQTRQLYPTVKNGRKPDTRIRGFLAKSQEILLTPRKFEGILCCALEKEN